ncbi:arylesterase [Hyphomonas oceanitis]|uniref:arylesterase n=1 Tax=Hyphomonas oceanitis TaxID=81033 RepID=UPI00138DE913|nr:arylesterase [Hyphomonas oceanitis]
MMSVERTGLQGTRWSGIIAILFHASILAACGAPPANVPAERANQSQESTPPAIPASGPVVVFLGDSLTAGFGLAAEEALPEQVANVLKAEGIEARVVNAGVSGDTTANGLARFDWSVTAANADMVVIALGANDYLMGITPELAKQNLSAIIQKAKDNNIDCILVDLQPRSAMEEGGRDAAFASIYPDLAAQFGLIYYPSLMNGVENQPDLLQSDGLHPTSQGVRVMAENLAHFLEPVIERYE